jgi:glucan phosphoethanolaminetransferase (alkaline phosphatase superfamily)
MCYQFACSLWAACATIRHMAHVKLFRVTEFAESVFQSPLAHRTAIHPAWVMLLLALWMAVAGHVPLWRALWGSVILGQAGLPWLAGVVGQVFLLGVALMALMHWHGLFKWGAALVLAWSALGGCALALRAAKGESVAMPPAALFEFLLDPANLQRLLDWRCLLALTVTGLLPMLLLWRMRVRRLPLGHGLLLNAIILVATGGLLLGLNGLFDHEIGSPLDWRGLLR